MDSTLDDNHMRTPPNSPPRPLRPLERPALTPKTTKKKLKQLVSPMRLGSPAVRRPQLSQHASLATRNLDFLTKIFSHEPHIISDTFHANRRNFPHAYNALVALNVPESGPHGWYVTPHGPPGAQVVNSTECASARSIPTELRGWWTEPRPTTRALSATENALVVDRAEALLRDLVAPCAARPAHWDELWKFSYHGFKHMQRELGMLRDDALRNRLNLSASAYNARTLAEALNDLLLAGLERWCAVWGELDLHRVGSRDAPKLIHAHVMGEVAASAGWCELRIVAGQRKHAGVDHHSEGLLFDMLNAFFDAQHKRRVWKLEAGHLDLISDVQALMLRDNVTCTFFSNRASVQLNRAVMSNCM